MKRFALRSTIGYGFSVFATIVFLLSACDTKKNAGPEEFADVNDELKTANKTVVQELPDTKTNENSESTIAEQIACEYEVLITGSNDDAQPTNAFALCNADSKGRNGWIERNGKLGDCLANEVCDDVGDCEPTECTLQNDCLDKGEGLVCGCAIAVHGDEMDSPYFYGSGNFCVTSTCTTSDDCDGGLCRVGVGPCQTINGYYCTADSDECQVDSDCPDGTCYYDVDKALWTCSKNVTCD